MAPLIKPQNATELPQPSIKPAAPSTKKDDPKSLSGWVNSKELQPPT